MNLTNQILNWIEREESAIVNFCAELVRCNTSSSHGDTRSAAQLIENFFAAEVIAFQEFAARKTMPNLFATTKMFGGGRHLMFNGHLDVMPVGNKLGWSVEPWSGTIRDGKIFGRGVSDMKAGVTAMIFAYKYLNRLQNYLRGRLSLTIVSDEESGWGRGTGFLFKTIPEMMTAAGVLSGEPSGVDAISFSSKGYVQITVKVSTRGAIAGYSNDSKNSVEIAASLIRDLKALENFPVTLPEKLRSFMDADGYKVAHEKTRGIGHFEQLSRVTVDICTIKGGAFSSVIADSCKFTAAIVIPLGTDIESLLDELKRIVKKYPETALRIDGIDLPDISAPNGELAKILGDTAVELGKTRPLLTPEVALSDCRYWRYRGTPAYWYGAGGELCSAPNEFVTIEDLIPVTKVHALTALKFLSSDSNDA